MVTEADSEIAWHTILPVLHCEIWDRQVITVDLRRELKKLLLDRVFGFSFKMSRLSMMLKIYFPISFGKSPSRYVGPRPSAIVAAAHHELSEVTTNYSIKRSYMIKIIIKIIKRSYLR